MTLSQELQLQVTSMEALASKLGSLEQNTGRLSEENETLRREKQVREGGGRLSLKW